MGRFHHVVRGTARNCSRVPNAETGRAYMKPKPPIEAMIDEATGKAQDDAFAFARWVTENHWGMEYAPEAFREECERRDREEGNGRA